MGNKETVKDLIFTGHHQVFRTQAHFTQIRGLRCVLVSSHQQKNTLVHLVQRRNTALAGRGMQKHRSLFSVCKHRNVFLYKVFLA